ncbi:MAG: hypothetical protein ACD_72C00491G0001 [uncultured bacterium]|nr:MAG: hypothetical protein ACD_72C00491G0001 [uncultured bacterium]
MGKFGTRHLIRVFDVRGKKLSEFSINSTFGNADLNISATDVNFDGKAEIVVDGN